MAQITLTSGSAPAFLSKNYFNRDAVAASDLTVSTGDAIKNRLYDMDFSAYWSSVGSNDTITETITAGMYQGSTQTSRSADFFAIMATNAKNLLLEYSNDNGVTWTTVSGFDYRSGVANFAGTNLIASLAAPITFNKIRLSIYKTQTANAEKTVGGIVIALGTFQSSKCMVEYEPSTEENTKELEMADNSLSFGHVYRSDASFEIFKAKVGFSFVSESERTSFRSLKNSAEPWLFYAFPGDRVQELYLGKMKPGSFRDPYSTTYTGAGHDINFEFREVGGA